MYKLFHQQIWNCHLWNVDTAVKQIMGLPKSFEMHWRLQLRHGKKKKGFNLMINLPQIPMQKYGHENLYLIARDGPVCVVMITIYSRKNTAEDSSHFAMSKGYIHLCRSTFSLMVFKLHLVCVYVWYTGEGFSIRLMLKCVLFILHDIQVFIFFSTFFILKNFFIRIALYCYIPVSTCSY